MTQLTQGFFLERIAVVGTDVNTVEVEFSDGLNVISGASDTGKSYLCSLVNFVFGSSSTPRDIEQAKGYSFVLARLRDRASGTSYEIERALVGGDVRIRTFDRSGAVVEDRIAAARHKSDDSSTLSAFLLERSGFGPAMVRKNKKGQTRSLSFRDIAFLVVVDETRIISENPPQLSGNYMERTVEGEVFRLLVTGIPSTEPIVVLPTTSAQGAKAQLELVIQLTNQIEAEMEALPLDCPSVDQELTQLNQNRADSLGAYESSRVELVELERELSLRMRALQEAESRLAVNEGLIGRFGLLDRHYESDIERLDAIKQAGSMLEALPTKSCPVCGAPVEEHRTDQAAAHFRTDEVRRAAAAEREKTEQLRADLQRALHELDANKISLERERSSIRTETIQIEERISNEVRPRVRVSAGQLQVQNARRDLLLRGRVLMDQHRALRDRIAQLETQSKRVKGTSPNIENGPTTASMEAFAQEVQEILSAWHFPETGRVVFSEESQDLVIEGQPRVSHGKGVRALSCAAFITGLMRLCLRKGLAHPGLVVLDSPLVAYKDPDSGSGAENERIRQAGVKEAFYKALADGLCIGQIIILENEDPAPDVTIRIKHHHFSRGPSGRYGFYPFAR